MKRNSIFGLNIVSFLVFTMLAFAVSRTQGLVQFDSWFYQEISFFHRSWLTKIYIFITHLGSPLVLAFLSAGIFVFLIRKREWYSGLLLLLALLWGAVLEIFLKSLLGRVRPPVPLVEATGFSFPSGHATFATIFFLFLIFIFHKKISRASLRYLFVTGSVLAIFFVASSRLYLQVHWLSDVIGGIFLGVFVFTFIRLVLSSFFVFHKKSALP